MDVGLKGCKELSFQCSLFMVKATEVIKPRLHIWIKRMGGLGEGCKNVFKSDRSPFQKSWRVPCSSLVFIIGTSLHLPKMS